MPKFHIEYRRPLGEWTILDYRDHECDNVNQAILFVRTYGSYYRIVLEETV